MCDICDNPATKRCSSCCKKWYCSEECQKQAWPLHIFDCTPQGRPIKTAYYLYQAVALDVIPGHPQTREAYGFNRVPEEEEGNLVGLYTGLIKYLCISPDELHQWRKQGIFVAKIKEKYEQVPEENRGQYYPWFLRNEHVLDLDRRR